MATPPKLSPIPADQPVTLSLLLGSVVENYGAFYELRAQHTALQDWIRAQKAIDGAHR